MAPSAEQLAELIDDHLGDMKDAEPNWKVGASPIAGRGIIAARDIQSGELIFSERALIIGPTARKGTALNTCVICYRLLSATDCLCKKGCGLPTCEACSDTERHRLECNLFQQWQPIDVSQVNPMTLRILTAVRSFFLTKRQRELLNSMQANADRYYRMEIERAADGFKNFPKEEKVLNYIYRTVSVLNTNAFEARSMVDGHEYLLRGLFPLAGVMNHECTPNACHYFENGDIIFIKAARFIPKGAEITTTYTKIMWSNLSRRVFLKMTKHFVCACPRCKDPAEKGSFISALYCRNTECPGLVVPETTNLPHPNWNCLECKQKSNHSQMLKSQDFASGALNAKLNADSIKVVIDYINEKSSSFIPSSNYIVIDAKLQVIAKLSQSKGQCDEEAYKNKERYCSDILEILDKLGVGDCPMRAYLETEKAN